MHGETVATTVHSPGSGIPPLAQAALEFLQLCREIRAPFCEGLRDLSRNLTREEAATESAALLALRLYFSGEMYLGDTPLAVQSENDDGDSSPRVPTPT